MSVVCAFGSRIDVFANSFREGGWKLDVQFMDKMGSPYLLAHGLGSPVPDATATATVPEAGMWRVYVRSRKWVDGAGFFKVLVDGRPLAKTFGSASDKWGWEDGGEVGLKAGAVKITLRDLDGFDGRCAGIVLVKGEDAPEGAINVLGRPSEQDYDCDFVVVGGGLAGCCAAVAAARAGIRVALVQDRPVPGGNASGEVRVWSAGEIRYPLVNELRGKFMNKDAGNALSDQDRIAILEREPNLSCFYWHRAFGVEKRSEGIVAVKALDVRGNRVVRFHAPLFCDATGDGWIGYWAGADWRSGREAKSETGESLAPEKGDEMTLGSSIMWDSAEGTYDIPFSAPWAEPYACGLSMTTGRWDWEFGLTQNIFEEGEAVRDRILLAIYGTFSNAKKDPRNAHRRLVTCPFVLGKRESRRLMGDYIFCEQDVREKRQFEDAVATGSWSIDLHYTKDEKIPFVTKCEQTYLGRYWIPYRSLYSRNVPNLFMAGRCFSCTHVGLGSPRVMNTLAQMGCVVGEAAAMCRKGGYSPRGLYSGGHVRELQHRLGGAFPGVPDPKEQGWLIVDDEDKSVSFEGDWYYSWNCNGGAVGLRSHFALKRNAKAVYPLPVKQKGRYLLKGRVPHLFTMSAVTPARLTIRSGEKATEIVWNQLPESGTWRDLGTVDLEPGATLEMTPAVEGPAPDDKEEIDNFVADGFALVALDADRCKFAVADRAVTGDVTVVSVPWQFKDGRIDWLFNPTKGQTFNPEWTWQLNRMYFWQDFVRAYEATKDEKYVRAFVRQLGDWLDQTGGVPPEKGYNDCGSAWRTIEEGLRLMGSWHEAWHAFRSSPLFTPDLQERFKASALAQARHILRHRTKDGNWLMMEMNGVYALASDFPELEDSARMRKEASDVLSAALRRQILPDGLQYELSPDYHYVAIMCARQMYETAAKSGFAAELPADFAPLLERMADAVLSLTTPSFVQPRFNDCFSLHGDQTVGRLAPLFPTRQDLAWLASRRASGQPPAGATASRYLPWAGFAVMRSDWGPDATYLAFDVGPLGRAHAHQDKLSFTLWKGGEELVFDDGGGQYDNSPERAYAISGHDHNTLLVDGLAQKRSEPHVVMEPIDAGWETTPERDRAFGVYDQGFGPDERRLATHRREIVFDKKADRFVITDDVRSVDGKEHDYAVLFQLDTTNTVVSADGKSLLARYGRVWDLSLEVAEGGRIETVMGRPAPNLAGWYVARNDQSNHVATTVFVRSPKDRDRRLVTILRPLKADW